MIAFIVELGQMNLFHYMIGFLLAAVTAFTATCILGVDNRKSIGEQHENQKNSEQ
ncbi:Negative regulator of SacY activity [compost metagenome]